MKPPLSPSYKFEKEEEGGEGLEEEEGEAAPPAVIPGSATGHVYVAPFPYDQLPCPAQCVGFG